MLNSLGLPKNPADTRVVVAMSGGVDSSVVAAMLREEGYDVIGITLQLYDHGAMAGKKGACCAGQDIQDARRVCDTLEIPHYILNYENKFRQEVMEDFVDTYLAGETPIPCVKCNQSVKFRDLLQTAHDLGADAMATGHYVQRKIIGGKAQMVRAADPARDQSYFLFATTGEQLNFLRFPLGHLKSKEETRALAARFGLEVADKPDSQDICFVPAGGYARVIEKLRPGALDPGEVVHVDGTVLGKHDGIVGYTVGQRKGLGIGGGDALYVIRLDAQKKQVIVGAKEDLLKQSFIIRECNWLNQVPPFGGVVKLRSMHKGSQASIERLEGHRARVTLLEPEGAISPGQACVAYDGEQVLGGGWITPEAA